MKFNLIRYISKKFAKDTARKRFVNFAGGFSFASVMLGSCALIIALSVLDGFDRELRENAVKFTSHISLQTFEREPIENYEPAFKILENNFPGITKMTPVVQKESLIRSNGSIEGILIKGIKADNYVTDIKNSIVEGKFSLEGEKNIILGKMLAGKIGASVGEKVVIYTFSYGKGGIKNADFHSFEVSGIYETGMAQYDELIVYTGLSTAQDLFGYNSSKVTAIEIMLDDVSKANPVSLAIEDELGYPYYALSVYDLHRSIFAWIELQKEPIPIVLGLISIVAVLNIITTLLIIVVEKTYSIGILRTLGMTTKGILKIFVFRGLKIGVSGSLSGAALGFILVRIQKEFEIISLKGEIYFLNSAPVDISLWHYEVVIGVSIILTLLSTLIPSYIASKIRPLRAIRFK